jgi:hypothetical protein
MGQKASVSRQSGGLRVKPRRDTPASRRVHLAATRGEAADRQPAATRTGATRPNAGPGWPDDRAAQEERLMGHLATRGPLTAKACANGLGLTKWWRRTACFQALDRLAAAGRVRLAQPGEAGLGSWSWRKPRFVLVEEER